MPKSSLKSSLESLAASFASSVLTAIRGASLEELMADSGGGAPRGPGRPRGTSTAKTAPTAARASAPARKSGRLPRRSPEEIARAVDLVAKLVKTHKDGLRAEQIKKMLGMDRREVPKILREGLAKKKLKSKGQKRATTYFAVA
jgi:hypothetical protein